MIRPVKKLIIQAGSYNKHFYQIQCTLSSDSWLLSLNPPRLPTEQEIFGELKNPPRPRGRGRNAHLTLNLISHA